MYYYRLVHEELLEALAEGGSLHELVALVRDDPDLDLQLRADPKARRSWATAYVGLTKILDVVMVAGGGVRLSAHLTYSGLPSFDPSWRTPQSPQALGKAWPAIRAYLKEARAHVAPGALAREGRVQTLLARGSSGPFALVDAQAVVGFDSVIEREALFDTLRQSYSHPLKHWIDGFKPPAFGPELDLLAVDATGRLLAVEVKHASDGPRIGLAPAQVGFYTAIFRRWASAYGARATETIRKMIDQRARLGLTAPPREGVRDPLEIVPVVAIGPVEPGKDPMSPAARERFAQVREGLRRSGLHEAELRVWAVAGDGRVSVVETPPPDGAKLRTPVVQLDWSG